MAEELDLTAASKIDLQVTTDAVILGNHLAQQSSVAQAEVLWGFAAGLYSLGPLDWRMQCAYIREEFDDATRTIIEDVLRELLAASPSTEGDGTDGE